MASINAFTVVLTSWLPYDSLSRVFGAVAVCLLIGLLIVRETMAAASETRRQAWRRRVDIAIAPLLAAFVTIIVSRLLDLTR